MKTAVKFTLSMLILTAITAVITFTNLPHSPDSVKTQNSQYTVKEYNGKIAVFKKGQSTPDEVLDIFVDKLPIRDREKLKNGIGADSAERLERIIEDYDG